MSNEKTEIRGDTNIKKEIMIKNKKQNEIMDKIIIKEKITNLYLLTQVKNKRDRKYSLLMK